jgi:putative membrane protein
MIRLTDQGYRDIAAALFALVWVALAIAPLYRHDWMLENLLVVFCAGCFLWWRKSIHLSKLSITLVFIYLCFHEVGAHYTYSKVPYDAWAMVLTGGTITEWLGLERNHFDRLVHFLYGALLAYPMREVYVRKGWLHGRLTFTFPVAITLAFSATYEIFEWWAAELAGGDLGIAYLGTQGDIWDAQKDMGLAGLGALLAIVATAAAFTRRRPAWDKASA